MTRMSHSFSIENAELYGVDCAILINHFQFWIEQNQRMGRNFHDGRTWMYQTQKEIAAIYPYWGEDAVQKIIKKLVDFGVLVKGNFNKTPFDKTIWYAFENEKIFTKPLNSGIDSAKQRNQNPLNSGIRIRQSAEPIPDTKTDTKKDKKLTNCKTPSSSSFIFSKTIDKKLLDEKLSRDERTTEEFLKECVDHVDNCSDKKFPRLQRAGALVKLLKQMKESDMIFREVCKETKKQKERSNETDQERMNRQYVENEIEKEARDPTYQSKFLEKERQLQQTKPGYKSKFL